MNGISENSKRPVTWNSDKPQRRKALRTDGIRPHDPRSEAPFASNPPPAKSSSESSPPPVAPNPGYLTEQSGTAAWQPGKSQKSLQRRTDPDTEALEESLRSVSLGDGSEDSLSSDSEESSPADLDSMGRVALLQEVYEHYRSLMSEPAMKSQMSFVRTHSNGRLREMCRKHRELR